MLYLVNDPQLEDALAPYRERVDEVCALQKRAKSGAHSKHQMVNAARARGAARSCDLRCQWMPSQPRDAVRRLALDIAISRNSKPHEKLSPIHCVMLAIALRQL